MPKDHSLHAPLPGDLAMWFFILAELTVFALLILAFAITERLDPELYTLNRARLDLSTGLALTISLLTSGYLAAMAVTAIRKKSPRLGSGLLLGACLSATVYTTLKFGEYQHLASQGLDIDANRFFTLYWIVTGFHFLHVLLGLIILAFMSLRAWRNYYPPEQLGNLESGVLYWHMVDLIWVVLFPLIYLPR